MCSPSLEPDIVQIEGDGAPAAAQGPHEGRLDPGQVLAVEVDAVAFPLPLQLHALALGLRRVVVLLVRAQEAHAEVDLLPAFLAAGPEGQLLRAGQVEAARLVAPIIGRMLPGHAHPHAGLVVGELEAGLAAVGRFGAFGVHGQRVVGAHPPGREPTGEDSPSA